MTKYFIEQNWLNTKLKTKLEAEERNEKISVGKQKSKFFEWDFQIEPN